MVTRAALQANEVNMDRRSIAAVSRTYSKGAKTMSSMRDTSAAQEAETERSLSIVPVALLLFVPCAILVALLLYYALVTDGTAERVTGRAVAFARAAVSCAGTIEQEAGARAASRIGAGVLLFGQTINRLSDATNDACADALLHAMQLGDTRASGNMTTAMVHIGNTRGDGSTALNALTEMGLNVQRALGVAVAMALGNHPDVFPRLQDLDVAGAFYSLGMALRTVAAVQQLGGETADGRRHSAFAIRAARNVHETVAAFALTSSAAMRVAGTPRYTACLDYLAAIATSTSASDACYMVSNDLFDEAQALRDGVLVDVHDALHDESKRDSRAVILIVVFGLFFVAVQVTLYVAQRTSTEYMRSEIVKRKATTEAIQAFVPTQFLLFMRVRVLTDLTVDDPRDINVTILSSDIRSFTAISEKMTDVELFGWLQRHLSAMTAATRRSGGFVEKFIGDAVLAIFKTPAEALCCGIDIQQVVSEANVDRVVAGEEYIVRVGVGIHTGKTQIGILGNSRTQNTAAVSPAVMLANRFEELTKVYGAKIVISATSFTEADLDISDCRNLGEHKYMGQVMQIVDVFATEPLAVKDYKHATREDFEAAVAARDDGNIKEANALFDKVLAAPRPKGYEDLAVVKVIDM